MSENLTRCIDVIVTSDIPLETNSEILSDEVTLEVESLSPLVTSALNCSRQSRQEKKTVSHIKTTGYSFHIKQARLVLMNTAQRVSPHALQGLRGLGYKNFNLTTAFNQFPQTFESYRRYK